MSSYRDVTRSPVDRAWPPRDDSRSKDDRDSFYRGRSPGMDRNRRSGRSRSPAAVDRYEPRSRVRDEYNGGRDRDRDDRRRGVGSPPANIDRYIPGQQGAPPPQTFSSHDHGLPPMSRQAPYQHQHQHQHPHPHQSHPAASFTTLIPDPLKLPYQVGFSYFGEWWRANEKIREEKERQRTGRRPEPRGRDTPEEREREKAKIQAAYDAYKEELQGKMARTFVNQHKEEQWFQERYVPENRKRIRQQLCEIRKDAYRQWEQDLDGGLFDGFTLEGVPKGESNAGGGGGGGGSGGAGGSFEKEEGETTAANETLGVGDLVPSGMGSDLRDESVNQPTLLIKTIAPSVSRQNLEAFCREHLGEGEGGFRWLSLSDPNPSKRYHRIGWIMLNPAAEKSDGTDDAMASSPATVSVAERALDAINSKTVKDEVRGDFVCHVGVHNPPNNPRRKALWDLFSAPERIDKDLSMVQRLVAKFEDEVGAGCQGVLKVEERVEELRQSGRLQPVGSTAATATGASGPDGQGKNHSSSKRTSSKKKKTKRGVKNSELLGMDVALDGFEDMDTDMGDEEEEGEEEEEEEGEEEEDGAVEDENVTDDEDLLVKKKQLDLLIEYLRRVFYFCFFCVFESDSVHELSRKCPGGHLRRPRNTLTPAARAVARASAHGEPFPYKRRAGSTAAAASAGVDAEEGEVHTENGNGHTGGGDRGERKFRGAAAKTEQQMMRAYNWVRTFEEKLMQILEPGTVDLRKYGGKPVEDALQDEMVKFVKQEDEHKWRCKLPECSKLFKEEHFWRKHVEKRHTEWYDGLREEFELINAYVSDPSHIAPSRTDANSNGHFPAGNGQTPTGTPRGFNLQNFSLNSVLPPLAGFASSSPVPNGFPPNMYHPAALQAAAAASAAGGVASWQPGGGGPAGLGGLGAGDDRMGGGIGPIRRGGGMGGNRFNNNRAGPYDRRPMRWSQDGGFIGGGGGMYGNGGGFGGRNGGRGGSVAGNGLPGGIMGGGPIMGGGSLGVANRWGDGGGGAAGGPREAIQGRTIKSYEDLDQVSGGGGGELNY